jgi:hypothetical protein
MAIQAMEHLRVIRRAIEQIHVNRKHYARGFPSDTVIAALIVDLEETLETVLGALIDFIGNIKPIIAQVRDRTPSIAVGKRLAAFNGSLDDLAAVVREIMDVARSFAFHIRDENLQAEESVDPSATAAL